MSKNYYQALGVSESATQDDIKKAYRDIAKKFHPDKNPGDKAAEEKFKEASEAYETLKNKDKRAKYDQLRKSPFVGKGGTSGGGGMTYEDFMREYGGVNQQGRGQRSSDSSGGFGFGSVEDLFGNLFGGGARAQKRTRATATPEDTQPQPTDDPFFKRKGNDAYIELSINLAQALLGSKVRVRTPQNKRVTVRINPVVQPEKVLRVPNMGYKDGKDTGNLYITLHLKMPNNLDATQIEAAQVLAESLGLKY